MSPRLLQGQFVPELVSLLSNKQSLFLAYKAPAALESSATGAE